MSPADIRVWILEDNARLRQQLGLLCTDTPGLGDGRGFPRAELLLETLKLESAHPDVLLLDVGLPGRSGLDILEEMGQLAPHTRILVLTVFEEEDKIARAINAGASGYLLKGSTPEQIIAAIHDCHEGGSPISPRIASRVFALLARLTKPAAPTDLSPRETELLKLLVEGLTNKEISHRLDISPHTTDTHLRRLFVKLHVRSRAAAVARALKSRLV